MPHSFHNTLRTFKTATGKTGKFWSLPELAKTYPNVNQFGQFSKDEFLKTPVYSRDYPPCKFC